MLLKNSLLVSSLVSTLACLIFLSLDQLTWVFVAVSGGNINQFRGDEAVLDQHVLLERLDWKKQLEQ